jgi:Kinesin motor domain
MLIPSLISTDSSEAHIYGAGSFLDGIYGDNLPSRAATPMTVGKDHFHSANSNAPIRELSCVKRDEGLYRQWATLGLDRNFTPIKDISTHAKLHSRPQDITFASTPSRKHALQRPLALPTHPDISGASVSSSRSMDYAVIVSMYEVYNDRIFDLLSYNRGAKDTRRRPLLFKFTEGSPDRKVVAGLRKIVCGSYEEAIMVLETGLMERRVAGTGSNSVSSRSHGFFCVEVKKRPRGGMAGSWSSSTLTIVDLAGTRRVKDESDGC